MGASFADESGLDMAPPAAGQVAFLEGLQSIGADQFRAAGIPDSDIHVMPYEALPGDKTVALIVDSVLNTMPVNADGSPAGRVGEPYLGLDDWGAGDHTYRSRPTPTGPERPGPDAGDGPWTVELAIEVTTLES